MYLCVHILVYTNTLCNHLVTYSIDFYSRWLYNIRKVIESIHLQSTWIHSKQKVKEVKEVVMSLST